MGAFRTYRGKEPGLNHYYELTDIKLVYLLSDLGSIIVYDNLLV